MQGVDLRLVDSMARANELMSWLGGVQGPLAFDTETTGLDWWKDKIRLGVLGDERAGWAIPHDQWGGVFLEALRRWDGELVGHNAMYDWHMIREAGLRLPRHKMLDTQAMAHLANPLAVGLKKVAERELGDWAGDWERRKDAVFKSQKWDWRTVPVDHPAYWEYGASDAVLTARVRPVLMGQICGQVELLDLELAVSHIVADMELRGVRVDLDYSARAVYDCHGYAEAMRRRLADEWGLTDPGSNEQLMAALLANDAVDPDTHPRTAKTGQLATDAKTLGLVDHPMVRLLLEMRRTEKWSKAYFQTFIELADGDILHPSFKPLGARTARMACRNPPMQQVPRGSYVRGAFLAREGNKLLLADMDQIEIRLVAHFCQSPALLKAIREGIDLHVLVSSMALNKPMDEVDALERQTAKSASYAKAYGAGSRKFAATAGISAVDGADFYARYDAAIPEVRGLQQRIIAAGRRRHRMEGVGYVTTPSGRRIPCDVGHEYALMNYLVQGTAGDVFKTGLVRLDRAGLTDYLALLVHDEYIFDMPEDLVADAAVEVPRIAQDLTSFAVELTCGSDVYDRWSGKYESKPGWRPGAESPWSDLLEEDAA